MLSEDDKQQLLTVARSSIRYGLEHNDRLKISAADYPGPLREILATFVTLKINDQLRGCIGTTEAVSPLVVSVCDNAFSSAFHDPRFKPLDQDEFRNIHIDISILTPGKPVTFNSENELLAMLRPAIDGLIIEKAHQRATFLPSVWESLPSPQDFLQHLKLKARIPPDQCPDRAWVYQAYSITE